MQEALRALQDVVDAIKSVSPELLMILGLIAFGYVLKVIKFVKNDHIPGVLFLIACAGYPLLCQKPTAIEYQQFYFPFLKHVFIGMILWGIAWLIHEKALKWVEERWLNKWLPNKEQEKD
jgi:hypothetical protein